MVLIRENLFIGTAEEANAMPAGIDAFLCRAEEKDTDPGGCA